MDNLAAHVEYVLARCVRQAEEISKKVRAFRSLPCLTNPEVRAVRNGALETGPEPRVQDLNPGFGT